MEKVLTDVVNAGIALFKTGEEVLKNSLSDFEKKFTEIKQKGELDQSEQSVQIRDLLNKTIKDTKDVLKVGDFVRAKIIRADEDGRIGLSIKQLK